MSDTIFALASGAGPSAIAVVRVSGPQADEALCRLVGRLPPPRLATLASISDPTCGKLLDKGLVLRFPGPSSFTGEDSFELHLHGGRAVVASALSALSACPRLRLAEPGEFARRAFLNGKLDLTEAEGLADLIEARTETQRHQALMLASGRLRGYVDRWRESLLELLARIEAEIDFNDQDGVPDQVSVSVIRSGLEVADEIASALKDGRRGEMLREGFTVVLLGPPNAGKSSLLNALARRDAAIVSEQPGTTRDVIEVSFDLDGVETVFVDTAGLRETSDPVEREGVRRALVRASRADLVLSLAGPGQRWSDPDDIGTPVLHVHTKADLPGFDSASKHATGVSAVTGQGVDELLASIASMARDRLRPDEPALVTHERHRVALSGALEALRGLQANSPLEIIAEDLRVAARALSGLIGLISPEDILGEIFGRFCIGK